jgi:ABC-type Fe3+-hydroxamate transport system substrate-binding protein
MTEQTGKELVEQMKKSLEESAELLEKIAQKIKVYIPPEQGMTLYISRMQAKDLLSDKTKRIERTIRINDNEVVINVEIALSD